MSEWTAKRTQQLRDDWDAGLTCGQIGKRLGVTRSMVSAKASRLKLAARAPSVPHTYDNSGRQAKAAASIAVARPRPPSLPPGLTPPTVWKTFVDLGPGECRWPFGDRDFVFCALPADGALPYCACHARKAYQRAAA